jgi:hypothetical protein
MIDSDDGAGVSRRDLLRLAGLAGLAGVAGPALLGVAGWDLTAAAAAGTFSPIRPPATPLAVRSPYLTTWLPGDNLAGTWPAFWRGAVTAMTGIVRVDNQPYVFLGAPGGGYPLATQSALVVTATRSTYTLVAGPVTVTVTFFSPVDLVDLKRQSVPMSYFTVGVAANDGGSHQVSVYADISGEWAHGDRGQQITWGSQTAGTLRAHSCAPASPTILAENTDQASWGTVVFATDDVAGLTWQTGADSVVRAAGAAGTLANTNETNQPRAINNNWPVFAFNRALGAVGSGGSAPIVFTIGHVRTPAVSYLGAQLDPWWRTSWSTWQDMLQWFRADYAAALAGGAATDEAISAWAHQAVGTGTTGDQYAAICALALRQAVAGTELVNRGGAPWAMLKEISSNGDFSTVDVIYPAFPAYLQLSPHYLELVLAPIFDYAENQGYSKAYAPHDLGVYPNASGHLNSAEEDMPVEESANMLIMTAAIIARMSPERATVYAQQHYAILHKWADYLVANLPDPGNQNQTDDFTGFIAHSVNLALKGIVGIGAMAQVAAAAGTAADVTYYAAKARAYIATWTSMGQNSGSTHLKLTYDGADTTWSLKYNGYPDRLLGTNLVPPSVAAQEAAWYLQNQHTYGVLLDPRNQYTKTDWELWTAAFLAAHPDARDMLVAKAYLFANTSGSRVPFTDWYDTNSGNQQGFANRPVIGGLLALLTLRYVPNGLTGYWPFDGGNALDAAGASGDGTLAGGASLGAGKLGGAVSLNGTTASVRTPRAAVRTDASFTVTAWVNPSSTGGYRTAVSQDGSRASGFFLQYSAGDDRWAFAMTAADADNAATTRALSSTAPALNAWTHLAGVYDAQAGQLRLYVNGVAQGSAAYTGGWRSAGALVIGRAKWGGAEVDYFAGLVDEVRTFDHALSAAAVAASYHLTDNLVAAYHLDGAADDVAGGHTLTLSGGATFTAAGYSGSALTLGGTASASTAALVDTSASFSVATWVNLTDATGFHTVASQDGSQGSGFYLQYSGADNAWAFAMLGSDVADATATRAVSPFPPKVGGWTHLVAVHDAAAGQLRLYVNGTRAATVAKTAPWNATGSFAVGRAKWNGAAVDYLAGQVDQLKVWSRALSDDDVRALV